jgi:hypothetical protein
MKKNVQETQLSIFFRFGKFREVKFRGLIKLCQCSKKINVDNCRVLFQFLKPDNGYQYSVKLSYCLQRLHLSLCQSVPAEGRHYFMENRDNVGISNGLL